MPQFIISFKKRKKFHVKSTDKQSFPNLPPTGLTRQRSIKFKKEKWRSSFLVRKTKNLNFMSNIETLWLKPIKKILKGINIINIKIFVENSLQKNTERWCQYNYENSLFSWKRRPYQLFSELWRKFHFQINFFD